MDFYIRSRYTIDIIKKDLAYETGLKEELCESMAGMIKENYQTLQMGLIMSCLRKKLMKMKKIVMEKTKIKIGLKNNRKAAKVQNK